MEIDHVRGYYDQYSTRQSEVGVNERHRSIRDLTLAHGLKDGMHVLEIGCGVGTLTGLLAEALPNGRLLAIDLSPASINIARASLGHLPQVTFLAADAVDTAINGSFDMIILPDVLEHIPQERHSALFKKLASLLVEQGRILVHSPDPFYSDWVRKKHPEMLQVIDLSLHLPELMNTFAQSDLALHFFQRYSIWADLPDYMFIVVMHPPVGHSYSWKDAMPLPLWKRIHHALAKWTRK